MSRAEIVARRLAGVVEHTRPLNGDKYLVPEDLIHGAIEVLSELKADTTAQVVADAGFTVVDCTGISIGNSDIEASSAQGSVRPEDVRPGSTPLPIYPQPSDMPQPFIVRDPREGAEL